MVKLSLTIFFLFGIIFCYSQTPNELDNDTTKYNKLPFTVVKADKRFVGYYYNYVISRNDIANIKIKKNKRVRPQDTKIEPLYIYIEMKSGKRLLNFQEILSKFKIPTKYFKLPVYVDNVINPHPENSHFQFSAIKSIKIRSETKTGMKYISVLSISPLYLIKPGEIYIRGEDANAKVN